MTSPGKILLIITRRIGDVLLHNPDLDRVITVPERPALLKHLWLLARLFRRYDLAISTLPGDRPTLYACVAGKRRAGMVEQGGKQRWKQQMLSRCAAFDNLATHTVLMNLALADALGIRRSHEVVVSWTPPDEENAAQALPFDVRSDAFAVLHVYPKFAYKMWRQQNWAELARWLNDRGMRIVLTGGKSLDEIAYVEQVFRTLPVGAVNMAGKLSLAESAFLVSRARCYVGPDTSLTHVAAALGTPVVALFGPSNPVKWGPWPKGYTEDSNPWRLKGTQRINNVALVQGAGDCVPCMQEGCEHHVASLSDCLQNLPVASVTAALEELLQHDAS